MIWSIFMFSRLAQGIVYARYWHQDRWGKAKI